jgi:large repetitive protein
VSGGFYDAAVTQVTGGTLDLSAASGVSFGTSVSVSGSGVLNLGSLFVEANVLSLGGAGGGGMVLSNGIVVVNGLAVLGSGVLSGAGTTVLDDGGAISRALQLDGGLTLQNSGALDWTGGSIALGSGDASAATQAGVLNNVKSGVFDIETNGTISGPESGEVFNEGTILADGFGITEVDPVVDNTGTVIVSSGTLTLEQTVGGAGAFVLHGAATLDLVDGAGSGSTMQFLYPGGTLETQALGSFAPTISGFAAGDVIDAAEVMYAQGTSTVGFNAGTLTVTDGAQSATFSLSGSYAANSFQIIGSDGHGGTEVGYW